MAIGTILIASMVAIALVLGSERIASADNSRAAQSYHAGEEAFGKRDYPKAARAFEEAARFDPHAATLYNAGLSWQAAGEAARAADAYAAAIAMTDLPATQATDARARLSTLQAALGRIAVTAPEGATVSVAHADRASVGRNSPRIIHVQPASYDVRVVFADGETASRHVTVAANATASVAFEHQPKPAAPSPSASSPTPSTASRDAAPQHAAGTPGGRTLAWVAFGGAAVCGGASVFFGLRTLNARETFDQSGHTDRAAHDQAVTSRTATNIALAGAGVFAVTGAVLLLMSSSSSSSSSASPTLTHSSTAFAHWEVRAGVSELAFRALF